MGALANHPVAKSRHRSGGAERQRPWHANKTRNGIRQILVKGKENGMERKS